MRRDLAGYLDDDSVEVPGIPSRAYPEGKTYKFASPDAKTGMFLANLADIGIKSKTGEQLGKDEASKLELDDDEEQDLMKKVMGDTLDEMIADGVSWIRIQKLNNYLFIYFAMGAEVAELMATRLGEAQAPKNRAERRAKPKIQETPRTSTASNAGSKKPAKKTA